MNFISSVKFLERLLLHQVTRIKQLQQVLPVFLLQIDLYWFQYYSVFRLFFRFSCFFKRYWNKSLSFDLAYSSMYCILSTMGVSKESISRFDFLLKICWLILCLPSWWRVHTWIQICASLHHRKEMKAERSRLILRKHTENLVLLTDFGIFIRNQIRLMCTINF